MIEARKSILKHSFSALVVSALLNETVDRLPNIPYLTTAAKKIAERTATVTEAIFSTSQTIFCFAANASLGIARGIDDAVEKTSYKLHRISSKAEKERLGIYREQALSTWKHSINCFNHKSLS